jgi:hypothetical protein
MKKVDAVIKTDLASNWAKAVNYVPERGVIIVYEYEDCAPRLKVGDGITLVGKLPFLVNPPSVNQDILEL